MSFPSCAQLPTITHSRTIEFFVTTRHVLASMPSPLRDGRKSQFSFWTTTMLVLADAKNGEITAIRLF